MAASEPAREISLDREWWLRTLQVLQRPRPVFVALRDDSDAAAEARAEPMVAITMLAGVAAFLASSTAAHVYDGFEYDALVFVLEAVVAGAIFGIQNYWLGGGGVYLGARAMGGKGSYRQARHVIGFSMVPLIVWLVLVWPVQLAVYGSDLFRTGGDDHGAGRWAFHVLFLGAVAWGVALLLLGIGTLNRWSWWRTLAAGGLAVVAIAMISAIIWLAL
jgi:hypothetical protein